MAAIIWLAGLLTTGLGAWAVWQPEFLIRILHWSRKGFVFYIITLIKAAFGVIMLVWARACNRPGVIIALGIITLTGCIAAILAPRSQTQKITTFLVGRPRWFHRFWGLVGVIIGILIIWAGWPK